MVQTYHHERISSSDLDDYGLLDPKFKTGVCMDPRRMPWL